MFDSREGMLDLRVGMPGFRTQDLRGRLVRDAVLAEGPYRGRQMLQHTGGHIRLDERDLDV